MLRNGTTLAVRPIRPGDRGALARGFAALSPESRKRRSLAGKNALAGGPSAAARVATAAC